MRIRSILSFFSNDLGIDSIPIDVKELLHLYNERKSDIQLCRDSENYILSEKYKMFSAGGDVNLIDCNTMNYTSQRLLEFFIERKVHGIYLHSLKKSSCSYDAMCRQGRGLIHWFKVNISEFLLCSNELPLKGMCGGSPIFLTGPKSEKDRAAHYEEILRGIDRYCNDMKKIFGDMMPDFDYDSVIEWASFVKKHGTKYRKVVSEIKWASDYNHNNWKSILPLKQPIKSIKGLIDSVLGHLFPEK